MRKHSIIDVAADAGVSPTTVSHALSGRRPVSDRTKQRILESIERLNYQPDVIAASLRSQRTRTVGLVIADITNPHYPALARAAHDVLTPNGYVPYIVNTDGNAETEEEFLRHMVARKVDGIIVVPLALTIEQIRRAVGPEVPLVAIADADEARLADIVWLDQGLGIREAVHHLYDRGIRDVGFVGGPKDTFPSDVRLGKFREAMADQDLPVRPDWISHAPAYTRDGGVAAATRLFEQGRRPRAVLCANDLIAIGVLDVARLAGVRVPEELSVVGFDNVDISDLVSPRLTTVENPAQSTGLMAAQLLLEQMSRERDAAFRHVSLPTKLVVRASA